MRIPSTAWCSEMLVPFPYLLLLIIVHVLSENTQNHVLSNILLPTLCLDVLEIRNRICLLLEKYGNVVMSVL